MLWTYRERIRFGWLLASALANSSFICFRAENFSQLTRGSATLPECSRTGYNSKSFSKPVLVFRRMTQFWAGRRKLRSGT